MVFDLLQDGRLAHPRLGGKDNKFRQPQSVGLLVERLERIADGLVLGRVADILPHVFAELETGGDMLGGLPPFVFKRLGTSVDQVVIGVLIFPKCQDTHLADFKHGGHLEGSLLAGIRHLTRLWVNLGFVFVKTNHDLLKAVEVLEVVLDVLFRLARRVYRYYGVPAHHLTYSHGVTLTLD